MHIAEILTCVCAGAFLALGNPNAEVDESNAPTRIFAAPTIKRISGNQPIKEKNIERGNGVSSLSDALEEEEGEGETQEPVNESAEKESTTTLTATSEESHEQAANAPAVVSVKPETTVSFEIGKTQAVHVQGTPCWVRVEDVPPGELQLGVHSASGEPPSVDLFEAAEQVNTASPLPPENSISSFSPQGLGETSLVNYTIPYAGNFLVYLSRQDEQNSQVLLLIGPAPKTSETPTSGTGVSSPPSTEPTSTGLPQQPESVSETSTTETGMSSPSSTESTSTELPQQPESASTLPLPVQMLVVLLFLCLVVVVPFLAHRVVLHPSGKISADNTDISAVSPPVSDARYELDISAGSRSTHMPLNLSLLAQSPLTIGRSASCSISLDDPQVSSLHAQLDVRNGKLVLTDCHSTNGTRLNGKRVAPSKPIPLRDGDSVSIASVRIRIIQHQN